MLISFLFTRKTNLPFSSLNEMYHNTPDIRLAFQPNSGDEDTFKYSKLQLYQNIYKEKFLPYKSEYIDQSDINNQIHFILNDYKTAIYATFHSIM